MNWDNRGASIKNPVAQFKQFAEDGICTICKRHDLYNLLKTGFAQFAKDRICKTCKRQDLHNFQKTGFAILQDKV